MRMLVLLLTGFLLFGCLSTEIRHEQNPDGSADLTSTTYYCYPCSFLSFLENGSLGEDRSEELCADYEIECEADEEKVVLRKHYPPDEAFYGLEVEDDLFFTTYTLSMDVLDEPSGYSKDRNYLYGDHSDIYTPKRCLYGCAPQLNITDGSGWHYDSTLQAYGHSYHYIVIMPGFIVSAYGAEISGNSAKYGLTKLVFEEKPIIVVSAEPTWVTIILVVLVLSLFLALLIYLGIIIFKKAKGSGDG